MQALFILIAANERGLEEHREARDIDAVPADLESLHGLLDQELDTLPYEHHSARLGLHAQIEDGLREWEILADVLSQFGEIFKHTLGNDGCCVHFKTGDLRCLRE